MWQQEVRKAEEKAKRDAEAEEATKKKAEEAKKITIAEDASLPAAERTKISHLDALRGKRVKVNISLHIKQGVKEGLSGARWDLNNGLVLYSDHGNFLMNGRYFLSAT